MPANLYEVSFTYQDRKTKDLSSYQFSIVASDVEEVIGEIRNMIKKEFDGSILRTVDEVRKVSDVDRIAGQKSS